MIIILGAGRKAEHLCDMFNLWDDVLQFYDHPRQLNETKRDKPVLYNILQTDEPVKIISAVGETRPKRTIIEDFTEEAHMRNINYYWGTLIYKTADITNPTTYEYDFTARKMVCIGTHCRIGKHVSVGPLANLSHHSKVGDYSTICGQAAIGGGVTIGEGVFIGQGASVKPDIKIGDGAIIGTGAVVVKDVPPNMVVAGNPASSSPKFKGVTPW